MLGFVGAGAMGGAILAGLLSRSVVEPEGVCVAGSSPERSVALAENFGVVPARDAAEVAQMCAGGVIVMAVKPYSVCSLLKEMDVSPGTVVISVAAAVSVADLEAAAGLGVAVVRAMPNVGARVGRSMTALVAGSECSQEDLRKAQEIFEAVGAVEIIAEKDFSVFSAVAGCSPAFTAEYIDALARAGVLHGLPKVTATRIAAAAVEGAAALVTAQLAEGVSAADVADSVQSPGGTTVAGVVELEQSGFGAAVVNAVRASVARDRELQS